MNENNNIIFDLGGVLLHEPERNLSKVLLNHSIKIDSNTRIFNRMFEFANFVSKADCKKNWFLGKVTSSYTLEIILKNIDETTHKNFFKSENEKLLIKHASQYVLLANFLASLTYLDEAGFEFIKKCKESNKRVLILSNWDPESFTLIKNKLPQLFSLFSKEDIFIPKIIGFMKPEKECFETLIKMANISPENTIFIDDSVSNINAACQFGFKTIYHQNWELTKGYFNEPPTNCH